MQESQYPFHGLLILVIKLLEELIRAEIFRLLQCEGWTERTLAAALDKSQGALQGWTREVRPTKPGLDVLEGIASIKGIPVEQFVAELYGRAYAPTGDRTWAEIGAALSDQEFKELHKNLDATQLTRRIQILADLAVEKGKTH